MQMPPFLLDQWLDAYHFGETKIRHDLASSTGPRWSLNEILDLGGDDMRARFGEMPVCYSDAAGNGQLRAELGQLYGVRASEIQITTGAAEAEIILLFTAAEPGLNVILPFPVFPPIADLAKLLGLQVRSYVLRRENGFRLDPDDVKKLADKNTKMILVNSPHNPTGAMVGDEEMRRLHDFAATRGIQFVSDEVYHPLAHGPATQSAASLPHATIVGDFSKALCMSGLRIGWIIERDKKLLDQYWNARTRMTISNSPLCEFLAVIALQHRGRILKRALQVTTGNLQHLDQFFANHSGRLDWVRPEGGTTVFPWLSDGSDSRPFCKALAERGVLLAPGDCFGMANHFRLGLGSSSDGFPEALQIMSEFLVQNWKAFPSLTRSLFA